MSFLKIKADKIFDGFHFLEGDNVLIADENGTIREIVKEPEAGEEVQVVNGILSPGFINCHCHLELSHMKGHIPEDSGLVKFVADVVQQRHYPEDQISEAIEKAEDEMLANGIVAVGDICNNILTIPQKKKERLLYYNFIEASGFNPLVATERFQRAENIYNHYRKIFDLCSIVPHAPYSVSETLWEMIIQFPQNRVMSIHNQEAEGENEWFEKKTGDFSELYEMMQIDTTSFTHTGKSSLQSYLPKFGKNQSVLLVHNVHTNEADALFSKSAGINSQLYWCLCPNANKYITGQLPDLQMLVKNNCDIVLGTDSLASNHQLSILKEIKTLRENFPGINIEDMLKWATSTGARALELEKTYGSFEKGRTPGIILVDNNLDSAKRIK